jgi:hypothetical protein
VKVPATSGNLPLPFTASIAGSGSGRVGSVVLENNVGTVEIDQRVLNGVVYEQQSFASSVGEFLYQTLIIAPEQWFVVWFYCANGVLTDAYLEGTEGTAGAFQNVSGTCSTSFAETTPEVWFSATTMPIPPLLKGYKIKGPDISLHSGRPGTVNLGMGLLTVLPFQAVDCSQCGVPGWHEVHALLWDRARNRACFVIFYLVIGQGKTVQAAYSLTLPDLSDPASDTQLTARWSTPRKHRAVRR